MVPDLPQSTLRACEDRRPERYADGVRDGLESTHHQRQSVSHRSMLEVDRVARIGAAADLRHRETRHEPP